MGIVLNCSKNKILEIEFKPIILFAEGWNSEIQSAAAVLKSEGLIEPMIILRTKAENKENIKGIKKFIIEGANLEFYAQKLYELRKHKGITIEDAWKLVQEPNYLSAMMLKLDEVDGVVCGIEYTTKDTLRPALQIIKASKDSKIITSVTILERNEELLVFGDCSLILDPTSEELAEITKELIFFTSHSLCTKHLTTAMLSYSTNGSGAGPSVDKVKKAYELVKQKPELANFKIYGELQFDAAYVNSVRTKKASSCKWENNANIFVFPNLDSGNIGYKILERTAGFLAVGPVIIGLDKPMNDLSRGASASSVVAIAYVTASQVRKRGDWNGQGCSIN